MIVPTRFGLKYAPIPTLALEYEDDLKGVVDATGESSTSLYVYRDGSGVSPPGPTRKLHVVELPMLTRASETEQITRQLQQDNGRFLAPGIVSETQLKRLLDRLVQHLPDPTQMDTNENEPSLTTAREAENALKEEEGEDSIMGESVMEESVVEVSQSDEHETFPPQAQAENERENGSEREAETTAGAAANVEGQDENEDSHGSDNDHGSPPAATDKEKEESEGEAEAEEDAKKTKVLRSESDVSEEEVQSEELEYFSEDGSDEDSF
ncbi:hypothetical protein JG687_00002171 [Phytophthora cactorum]|uniref:Uncharacterized protein n=1 Tax=Phytophthora cactorum TaxID=29920 RepID=A0A329SPW5_9STRA|nr:hypothetical protein GQ600_18482 [Phytophthora cactorum]KAF1791290.1 hypothetical protein GQ600_21026 [Phytophthora cactorum]KAG2780802.1 hypothetical protein Pcac1_g9164 [Phytophthora cactorum]KAG2834401.1 hypothetical protein PC111_g5854 [Phytophthora cactorum]KAG2839473.1 hypothetical protein PC112_g4096 [Phytophthora cactorum]